MVHVSIAHEIPAKDIVALEIGNEPVLFTRDGGRPKPYTTAQQASDGIAAWFVHAPKVLAAFRGVDLQVCACRGEDPS